MDWLNSLIERLFSFLPSIQIVDSTEGGVSYWFGRPRLIKPKTTIIYLPLLCTLDIRVIVKQCINCQHRRYSLRTGSL